MTRRTLELCLTTPFGERRIARVAAVRLEAPDGARGILPGHEPAVTVLRPGALAVRWLDDTGGERILYVATDGGFAVVTRDAVRVYARWSDTSDDLPALLARLRGRFQDRAETEADARVLLQRHEAATRRALIALQREVTR